MTDISVMSEWQVAGVGGTRPLRNVLGEALEGRFSFEARNISFRSRVTSNLKSFLYPAQNVQAMGLLVSTMSWRSFWKLRSAIGHFFFFANSNYDHEYFLKSSFLFSEAEPVLLAWQLWRSPGWVNQFGDGTSTTRMKTWLPGVGETKHRRPSIVVAIGTRGVPPHPWSKGEKKYKEVSVWLYEGFIIYKPANFEEPVFETRCRYRFALRCFPGRGCTAVGQSGCSAGKAKKSSR